MTDVVFGMALYEQLTCEVQRARWEHYRRVGWLPKDHIETGFERLSDQELNAVIRRNQQDPR